MDGIFSQMQALKVLLPMHWLAQALLALGTLQLQRAQQHHSDHLAATHVHDASEIHQEA
jgi:hypothetical protein